MHAAQRRLDRKLGDADRHGKVHARESWPRLDVSGSMNREGDLVSSVIREQQRPIRTAWTSAVHVLDVLTF
jgi:hypothetical protein